MSKLVDKTQLQSVVNGLWTKSKEKFAQVGADNHFTKKNVFDDLNTLKSHNSIDYAIGISESNYQGRWTGLRSLNTALLDGGYVYKIRVYLASDFNLDTFTGLDIYPVKYQTNLTDDEVLNKLDIEETHQVVVDGSKKYIDIPINQSFNENTYFIIGATDERTKRFRATTTIRAEYLNDRVNLTSAPTVQVGISGNTNNGWCLKYELHGRENINDSIEDVINKSDEKYAKLISDNSFTGHNKFMDISLTNKDVYIGERLTNGATSGGDKKTGRRNYTSRSNSNSGFVRSLVIKVRTNTTIGQNINVSVWAVRKGGDISQDNVVGQIVSHKAFPVIEYKDWGKCIIVDINKTYTDETYFIYQINPSSDMFYANITRHEDAIYIIDGLAVTNENIQAHANKNAVGVYGIIGDGEVNLRDKISSLETELNNRIHTDRLTKLGGVTHAEKVPQLNAQGVLDVSFLPNLEINHIVVVQGETDAQNLVTQSKIKTGDVVIVRDNDNAIYMYNGQTSGTFRDNFIRLATNTGGLLTINSDAGSGGNIDLSIDRVTVPDNLVLKAGNAEFGRIQLMTEAEKNEIINVFNS